MEERTQIDTQFIKSLCYHIIDIIEFYELMERTPQCNDCGKKHNCEYVPDYGERVRYNCFLWEAAEAQGICKDCRNYRYEPQSGWMTCEHPDAKTLLPRENATCENWEGR